MIAQVIREATPEAVLEEYRLGASLATGFDVHISSLDPVYCNRETYRRIFTSAPHPTLCLNYDGDRLFRPRNLPEEQRIREMITAVECGANAIDLVGYSFDTAGQGEMMQYDPAFPFTRAHPREVTLASAAIRQQCRVVDYVHSIGGEVLISTHTGVYLHTDEVVSLAKWIEKRDPDIIKIVLNGCNTDERVAEVLASIVELKKVLHCRFSLHANGEKGVKTRMLGPLFGSYMMFTVREAKEGYDPNQLPLSSAAAFMAQSAASGLMT